MWIKLESSNEIINLNHAHRLYIDDRSQISYGIARITVVADFGEQKQSIIGKFGTLQEAELWLENLLHKLNGTTPPPGSEKC